MNGLKIVVWGGLLLSLCGCAVAPSVAPATPSSYQPQKPNNQQSMPSETYTVQKGDSVFSIMRETGVYWKNIIEMNNLQAPSYIIAPSQILVLKEAVIHRDVTAQLR